MSRVIAGFVICFLLMASALPVTAAETPAEAERHAQQRDEWQVTCEPKFCRLLHAMLSEGEEPKQEIRLSSDFDKASGDPMAIAMVVPPEADSKAGIEVAFTDLPVFDKDNSPHPPKEPLIFRIPIATCDKKSCLVFLPNGPTSDIRKYFIESFSAHDFFALGYEANGESRQFVELSDMFLQGYQTLQAAMKKPQ